MGNAMEGGEMKSALWTMALLLFANLPVLHLPDPSCDSGKAGERRKNKHFCENQHDGSAGKAVRSKGGKLDHGK